MFHCRNCGATGIIDELLRDADGDYKCPDCGSPEIHVDLLTSGKQDENVDNKDT